MTGAGSWSAKSTGNRHDDHLQLTRHRPVVLVPERHAVALGLRRGSHDRVSRDGQVDGNIRARSGGDRVRRRPNRGNRRSRRLQPRRGADRQPHRSGLGRAWQPRGRRSRRAICAALTGYRASPEPYGQRDGAITGSRPASGDYNAQERDQTRDESHRNTRRTARFTYESAVPNTTRSTRDGLDEQQRHESVALCAARVLHRGRRSTRPEFALTAAPRARSTPTREPVGGTASSSQLACRPWVNGSVR